MDNFNFRSITSYDVNDFIAWKERDEVNLSPKYQRNPVWNSKAKSYLLDTILRGLVIPPIFIRQKIDLKLNKTFKEVIDGQQRLRAIFEFKNNEFKILKEHNEDFAGMTYESLPDNAKEQFLSYKFSVEILKTEDEGTIYDMFARLNANSMTVNRQELRNAKYWGYFKTLSYKLAKDYKQFFIDLQTFNDRKFARMLDVEFISSLLIVNIDGIITQTQDKIDSYYKQYDENFDELERVEKEFRQVIDILKHFFYREDFLLTTFKSPVPFYTLYCVLHHLLFGIKQLKEENIPSILQEIQQNNSINSLKLALVDFESILERTDEEELSTLPSGDYKRYYDLHRTRTTSFAERKERISLLLKYILTKINDK